MSSKQANKKSLWTLAIVFGGLFIVFFIFVAMIFGSLTETQSGENQIGVVRVEGPIMSSEQVLEDIDYFLRKDDVKGILIRIDTPGGSVGASQEIFEKVKRAAEDKPIVISMGNMATSGGFYIAMAGPTIYANSGTITGSIGVITQVVEADALMDYLQLKVNTVKSGEYKDSGSPFRDFTEKDRQAFEVLITDIYNQFVDAVAESRELPREEVLEWADGRVFTGRAAKEAALIDELGGMDAAIEHLADELDFDGPANLVYPQRSSSDILGQLLSEGASSVREEISEGVQSSLKSSPTFEYRYVGPLGGY